MKNVLASLLLLLVSSNAIAEWTVVGENDAKTTYIDLATIRVKGDKVKMWSLFDFKKAQVNGVERFLSAKGQDEYDCTEEQARGLAFSTFSGNMGNGEVIWTNSDLGNWQPVQPGSTGETLWKTACISNAMAKWSRIGSTSDLTIYVDYATISVKGDKVKMWRLYDYKTVQRGMPHLSSKALAEYDCTEKQIRVLNVSRLSRNMGEGVVVWSYSDPDAWEPVPPNGAIETLWKTACSNVK